MPAANARAAVRWRGARRSGGALTALALIGLCAIGLDVVGAAGAAPTAGASAAPAVGSIAPNNGTAAGGTAVTITGTGFTSPAAVFFGGSPAARVLVRSPRAIVAISPPGSGTVAVRVRSASASSGDAPSSRFAYDPPPSGPWLGLNGLSASYLGDAHEYVEHGIVLDRSGAIEWTAGEGLASHGAALAADLSRGIVPVITIEYSGYDGKFSSDSKFPTEAGGSRSLAEYVAGFIATASAITVAHPGSRILFEPINEPWGYTTPQFAGGQYAAVIAKLLPAAREAHIPPESIYVGATGKHWIAQMYSAQPSLRSEVNGWYLHPYGPPSGSVAEDSMGVESVPHVQAEMDSGQNNLIISELGFCALDVNNGRSCGFIQVPHGSEAAAMLTATLRRAAEYHAAGWLRALLVYSRNDGGWAMELPKAGLTAQGEALEAFAEGQEGGQTAGAGFAAALAVNLSGQPPFRLPSLTSPLLCSLSGAFVCEL